MLRPCEIQDENFLNFATSQLSSSEYDHFVDFISLVDKLVLKEFKNIAGQFDPKFCFVVNSVPYRKYHAQYGSITYSPHDPIVDPIICDKKDIEGLSVVSIRNICIEYFKKIGWKFEVFKLDRPEHSQVELFLNFNKDNTVFNKYQDDFSIVSKKNFIVEEEDTTKPKENKKDIIIISAIDFDGDHYRHLEI